MKKFNSKSCEEIMTTVYKPIEFVVDGLITQGLYILAGAPKVGKSWLKYSFFANGNWEMRACNSSLHAGVIRSYVTLALAISNAALTKKFCSPHISESENLRYSARVWLINLGLNGEEFKNCHKHAKKNNIKFKLIEKPVTTTTTKPTTTTTITTPKPVTTKATTITKPITTTTTTNTTKPVTTTITTTITTKPVITTNITQTMITAKLGDLNGDDKTTVADIVEMQKFLVNAKKLTKEQWKLADMNSDGKVKVFDVIILKRRIIYG